MEFIKNASDPLCRNLTAIYAYVASYISLGSANLESVTNFQSGHVIYIGGNTETFDGCGATGALVAV